MTIVSFRVQPLRHHLSQLGVYGSRVYRCRAPASSALQSALREQLLLQGARIRATWPGLRIFSRVGYLEFLEGWDSRKHHPPTHPILWS